MLDSPREFQIREQKYYFEIQQALYTERPQQVLDEQRLRLEDRFHRTIEITRLSDSRRWTGASDIRPQYMNDLAAYLRCWLEDCFAVWDLDALPDGFEIPQGGPPQAPARHHCAEFPAVRSAALRTNKDNAHSDMINTASEQSFPASDPPQWTGCRLA
jgi:hypothetical protein